MSQDALCLDSTSHYILGLVVRKWVTDSSERRRRGADSRNNQQRGSQDERVAVAAAAAASLTGRELYAFPAADPARPPVRAAAPAPWCARPGWHRARPRSLQVKGVRLLALP